MTASGLTIQIFDQGTGVLVTSCATGTSCQGTVTKTVPSGQTSVSHTYIAYVAPPGTGYPPSQIRATSNTTTVRWTQYLGSITLTANPSSPDADSASTLTATATDSVTNTGFAIEIFDQGTATQVASCTTGMSCEGTVAYAVPAGQTSVSHVYIAYVAWPGTSYPPSQIQATSNTTTVTWVRRFASDNCDSGTNVFAGFVGDVYAKLRLTNGSAPAVCMAVEGGSVHVGGALTVRSPLLGVPTVDSNQSSCAAYPATNTVVRSGSVLSQQYQFEVNQRPAEVWVCVLATNLVAQRVIIPTSVQPPATPFVTDPQPLHGYSVIPASSGQPSAACQQASSGRVQILNSDVGTDHVWVYGWQESASTAHVCVRDQAANKGARMTISTIGGGTNVVQTYASNLPGCTFQVVDDNGPPPFSIYVSPPLTTPASACTKVGASYLSAVVNPSGGQSIVTTQFDS